MAYYLSQNYNYQLITPRLLNSFSHSLLTIQHLFKMMQNPYPCVA